MGKWRRKPDAVTAAQYDGKNPPPGTFQAADGSLFVVNIYGQRMAVNAGDWVVAESDGVHYRACADVDFSAAYEPG